MKLIVKAIGGFALASLLSSFPSGVTTSGMSRQKFQSAVHSLVDDEMSFLLERSRSMSQGSPLMESTTSLHSRTKSLRESNLRKHTYTSSETNELDRFFASIVEHGWDAVLGRSSEEDSDLFLVCHESPSTTGDARLQEIFDALEVDPGGGFETVHSSLDSLCLVLPISTHVALNWNTPNNSNLTLVPWVDVMKIAPGILPQLIKETASTTPSYSIVASILTTDHFIMDNVLRDVRRLAYTDQTSRRQQIDNKDIVQKNSDTLRSALLEAFSLTKMKGAFSSNESSNYWSRLLSQQKQDCLSMLNSMTVTPLHGKAVYRFHFEASTTTESCMISFVVALAIQRSVSHVGTIPSVELHNLHANWIVQGRLQDSKDNDLFPFSAAGLDGRSQVVAISDTGLDVNNCYFRDSVSIVSFGEDSIFEAWNTTKRKVLRYDFDSNAGDLVDVFNGHGTHVAATIIGSHINSLGKSKDGIAPASRAHFFDICKESSCISPQRHWFDSFNSNEDVKPKVASASWGTTYLTSYDWTCHTYDKLLMENPDLLLVSSAGNNGDKYATGPFHTIGAPASCKNTLAVGATVNRQFGPAAFVASFSSRGPTSDGRIKPDLLAPGYKLSSASAGHHNCHQEEQQFLRAGTSMAAPVVSGAALLIRQYFEESFYPCGNRGCGLEILPSGSLVKAILINGAQFQRGVVHASSGKTKTDQPLSDYDQTQGFGAADLLASLPLKEQNNFGIYVRNDVPISVGEEHLIELQIKSGCDMKAVSVTLAWYDPPAAVGCTTCLVNDLDVVAEDLTTSKLHYPNGASQPDRLNNVERIRISNAAPGQRYQITVSATRFGPTFSSQHYSLVATGCFESPDRPPEKHISSKSPLSETPVTSHSQEHQLTTSYRLMNNKKIAGIMFSVKAKSKGVTLHSFAIRTHVERDTSIYVYKLNDPDRYNETEVDDASAWVMISPPDGFHVNVTTTRSLTVLPEQSFQISIPERPAQSFYITFASEKGIVCGQPRTIDQQKQRRKNRDDNIEIMPGIGKKQLFGGRSIHPCLFEGVVMYSVAPEASGIFD